MAAIKFAYNMADNNVGAGITSVKKRHASLLKDVQMLAVSIIHRLHECGDGETATLRANALIDAVANGKQNSLRRWFETQANMVYNKETKLLVIGHGPASPIKHHSKIDAMASRDVMWYDAIPDAEYKPIADFGAQIAQLLKKGLKDRAELGDKSKVSPDQIKALELLVQAGKQKADTKATVTA